MLKIIIYDGFRQKTHFLKMLHLCLFLLFVTFPELLLNIDVGSKAHLLQPCRRASQGVLFLTSNKEVYHEVYHMQIHLLCYKWQQLFMSLYSHLIRFLDLPKVYSLLHPLTYEQNIKERSSSIQNPQMDFIISVVSILRDPVTWSKKEQKNKYFWLWPSIMLFHWSPFFFFAEPLWSLTLVEVILKNNSR